MTSIVHGTAPGIQGGLDLAANAKFMSFAPQTCICCKCFNSTYAQARTYVRAWDNRLEYNFPVSRYYCCSLTEQCIKDNIVVTYYDTVPFIVQYYWGVIPLNCCGPPVVYLSEPKCFFCISLTPCFGQRLIAAPCNLYGCKLCCCFGKPCYTCWGQAIAYGLSDGLTFFTHLAEVVQIYQQKLNIDIHNRALFETPYNLFNKKIVMAPHSPSRSSSPYSPSPSSSPTSPPLPEAHVTVAKAVY